MIRDDTRLVAAAGTRETAAQLASAGVDRIVAYHSSVYRNLGLPSVAGLLPWASANEQTLRMLPDVLAGASNVPVLATVCANDGLLPLETMIDRVEAGGGGGVLNAPTVGLLTGPVRTAIEQEGLGMSAEMRLLEVARARGLEAWAYVFDPTWTRSAVSAGATALILHLGLTGQPPTVPVVETIRSCLAVSADVSLMLHGGELGRPHDYVSLLGSLTTAEQDRVGGFFGASAFERAGSITSAVAGWRYVVSRATSSPKRLERT